MPDRHENIEKQHIAKRGKEAGLAVLVLLVTVVINQPQ